MDATSGQPIVRRTSKWRFNGYHSSASPVASETGSAESLHEALGAAAERVRIARELHDTMLQGFFALSMQLRDAVDQLPPECASRPRFKQLLGLCDRALDDGRLAIEGLRKSPELRPSLGHALANVPAELGFPSAVGFRVIVEGRQRLLRNDMSDEIYRIGREAIVNAYRHSRAEDIEAAIEYRPAELRIAVRDNGCGIDNDKLNRLQARWGILGMRERAEKIGANLRIMSRIALGTEVELCVPGRLAFEQA